MRAVGCASEARPIIVRTFCAASTARSAADFFSNSARSRSFDGSGGFGMRSPAAAARTFSGSIAAAFSLVDLPMSSSTSSLTSPSDEESSSRHGVSSTPPTRFAFSSGVSCCTALVTRAAPPPVRPSRRCTTFEAASTSSITKITSLKPSLIGTSSPITM